MGSVARGQGSVWLTESLRAAFWLTESLQRHQFFVRETPPCYCITHRDLCAEYSSVRLRIFLSLGPQR